LADLFRGGVLLGSRGFGLMDAGAPFAVQLQDPGRNARQAPAGHGRVEGIGIVADGADIVHGTPRPAEFLRRICRKARAD
jgi:hypothetical protein